MSIHDAFIQAIREAPDDDAPRLIYADYLEEHGDTDRAEFIRLQCEIAKRPLSENDPARQQLESREHALLRAYEDVWLGDALPLRKQRYFEHAFHRGFIEDCGMAVPLLLQHAATLMRCMPLWRDATLSRGRGLVRQLVALPEFLQLHRLTFASRLDTEDVRALAVWPGLGRLQSLRFWGGDDREHDQELCIILASSPHAHGLQHMEMIQVRRGIGSDRPDEDGAAWARRLEKRINARFGRPIFRARRPFAKTFAVKSNECYGFYAGTVPKKRQALIGRVGTDDFINVALFDAKGNLLEDFNRPLAGVLKQPPEKSYFDVNEREFHQFLLREFGFRAAPIRVKEFLTAEGLSAHLLPSHFQEYADNPNLADEERWGQEDADYWPILIQGWIDRGDFVLDWGNDYFMDANGEVTSS